MVGGFIALNTSAEDTWPAPIPRSSTAAPPGLDPRDVPWIVTLLSFAALCVAWLAQYAFGLAPCELCYIQRYGYWAVIVLGLVAIFFSRRPKTRKFWLYLVGIALLGVVGLSIFHVGRGAGLVAGQLGLRRRQHRRPDHRGN